MNIKIRDLDPKIITKMTAAFAPTIPTILDNTVEQKLRVSLNPFNDLFKARLVDQVLKNPIPLAGADSTMDTIFTKGTKMVHITLFGPENFSGPRTPERCRNLCGINGNNCAVALICFDLRHCNASTH